jgi:hypothetical protein
MSQTYFAGKNIPPRAILLDFSGPFWIGRPKLAAREA